MLYLSEEATPATKWSAMYRLNSGYTLNGINAPSNTYLDGGPTGDLWVGSRNTTGAFHVFTDGTREGFIGSGGQM
jgi:hypothetical protein